MSDFLSNNFKAIEKRIHQACIKTERSPAEVSLLPVSKTKSSKLISEAYGFGYKRFGESRIQEAEEKTQELSYLDIKWCIIGHLQTNKVDKAARFASEIHSLDSLKLAKALEKSLQKEGRSVDVLVQVNTSKEPQKFGLEVEEVESFVYKLKSFSSLRVKGLMTLALFSKDESLVKPCFIRLRELRDKLRQDGPERMNWDTLSMGMSQDLEWAIEEGSTEVRVGTSLFGEREPQKENFKRKTSKRKLQKENPR